MLEELKKRLDAAYKWLDRIPVTGNAVDCMAMARQELREAYKILEQEVEKNG